MNITKITNFIYEKYVTVFNKNFLADFNPYKIKTKKRQFYIINILKTLKMQK